MALKTFYGVFLIGILQREKNGRFNSILKMRLIRKINTGFLFDRYPKFQQLRSIPLYHLDSKPNVEALESAETPCYRWRDIN